MGDREGKVGGRGVCSGDGDGELAVAHLRRRWCKIGCYSKPATCFSTYPSMYFTPSRTLLTHITSHPITLPGNTFNTNEIINFAPHHPTIYLLIDDPFSDELLIQPNPVPDPVKDVRVPHQAVVPAHDPMALIREMQEARRHAERLEDVEERDAVGLDNAVVEVVWLHVSTGHLGRMLDRGEGGCGKKREGRRGGRTMHDELRRAEVLRVRHRIPHSVVLTVVPQRAVLVVLDEPQLLRRVGTELVALAVVRNERLELAA
jgi:hypothetical protein